MSKNIWIRINEKLNKQRLGLAFVLTTITMLVYFWAIINDTEYSSYEVLTNLSVLSMVGFCIIVTSFYIILIPVCGFIDRCKHFIDEALFEQPAEDPLILKVPFPRNTNSVLPLIVLFTVVMVLMWQKIVVIVISVILDATLLSIVFVVPVVLITRFIEGLKEDKYITDDQSTLSISIISAVIVSQMLRFFVVSIGGEVTIFQQVTLGLLFVFRIEDFFMKIYNMNNREDTMGD